MRGCGHFKTEIASNCMHNDNTKRERKPDYIVQHILVGDVANELISIQNIKIIRWTWTAACVLRTKKEAKSRFNFKSLVKRKFRLFALKRV